jgi:endonuclease/exonuclease/phosphatase family metal-dependent hydrolase
MAAAPPSFTVATFNLHAGIDGWGRPFDPVAACRDLDADVLVLQETWTPDEPAVGAVRSPTAPDGPPPGAASAAAIGAALGYTVVEHPLAHGRLAEPHPRADHRWMRPLDWRGSGHAIYLDDNRPLGPRITGSARFGAAEPGAWGLAVLSRLPITGERLIELPTLPRDRSRRAAIVLRVTVGEQSGRGDQAVTVVGTHMSHLTYGSPRHFERLRQLLDVEVGDSPAVLAGDMNLWGPPVDVLFRGWRRAVRGQPTWPAWRPHSQVDHVLVRGPVTVVDGRALPMAGSDHRPLRATLAVGRAGDG